MISMIRKNVLIVEQFQRHFGEEMVRVSEITLKILIQSNSWLFEW